jgi:hypothetical protein
MIHKCKVSKTPEGIWKVTCVDCATDNRILGTWYYLLWEKAIERALIHLQAVESNRRHKERIKFRGIWDGE